MKVAVIPARGGSKRIPRKNIRAFCGKPIIAWTVAALKASGCVDKIIVSTDDEEVAAVARDVGAEAPFVRPASLSDDYAPTLPVVAHTIAELQLSGVAPTYVCCAYATAPLMDPSDLRTALKELEVGSWDYVFSATTYAFPIHRALRTLSSGGVGPVFPEQIGFRSQDLPTVFHDAGQFYWGQVSAFTQQRPIFSARSRAHLIPRHLVQDIDTTEDWVRAELIFRTFRETSR
jgi:N-acylneuraminate cytidylyltransferase